VYPALALAPNVSAPSGADPLGRLLGTTRAVVLRRLAEPGRHTTTALGRHAGISTSSASEHAATLRAAGLVNSDRAGGAIVHQLTPLGVHLLTQNQNPSGPAAPGPGPHGFWPEPGPP
jgi:DNA-binding MarR family transcriptional regulator